MMRYRPNTFRQMGASLVVALIMTLLVMILGLSAAAMALQSEKASRNLRDRQIAFDAAQLALLDARKEIFGAGSRAEVFGSASSAYFSEHCNPGSAELVGLCDFSGATQPNTWLLIPFDEESVAKRQYSHYGEFTGALLQAGEGTLPSVKPRYIIDVMISKEMGRCADCRNERKVLYRVTAVGFGVRKTTQVMLQAVISKEG